MEKIQEYFQNNLDSFQRMVVDHIGISILSLAIAIVIGVGFGLFVMRHQKLRQGVVNAFGILRIIPSLAILILLIPLMGTGVKPSVVALVILAVPPILMNTVAGFDSVPDFMIETGYGQGMKDSEVLGRVSLPLAMPMIFAGIKTAMIEIIASATLAAKIGGGGLGELIFTGLGLNRMDLVLIGGISVAALSLMANLIASVIDRIVFRYKYV